MSKPAVPAIYTSCFARAKLLPPEIVPVSIARWPPRGWSGQRRADLAPSADLLRRRKTGTATEEDYVTEFAAQLARLNPQAVVRDLPPRAALLCFEPPGYWCHRRLVAEWLEAALGVSIPEYGIARDLILPAIDAPEVGTPLPDLPWEITCDGCRKSVKAVVGEAERLCPRCGHLNPCEWD